MPHTVTVKCASMPSPSLEFCGITGGERLSELYSYTISLKTPGDPNIPRQVAANVDYKQMIGKEFTVEIELGDLSKREISGLVTNAKIIDSGRQQSKYEITIEPWLILAKRTSDYKRFQGKTVVQILDEVLGDYTFTVEKRLIGNYSPLEYQVQYGETDFDFIQRLMQEWGIYWFFEHSEGKHRLILIDNMGAHKPPPSADYQTLVYDTDGGAGKEHLATFNAIQNHRSGQWVTDDFDFKKPKKKLQVIDEKPRQTAFPNQELYLWPGDYVERDVGQYLAEVRMQAAGVPGSLAFGSGNLPGAPCGSICSIQDYPADKANREYLIVASVLTMNDIGKTSGQREYRCDAAFEFLPTNTVFRPGRTIDKPRTTGPQTAVVVGPPGAEIHTDEYGRVKVQFHWDRYGNNDQDSSCWIRVSYPWAGSNFGGIQIPRIGQEVIVDFENGDPDRPIIIGRVYNGLNMPPWGLPDNATQSGLLSRSSKGGGPANANALRFEDKKGEEEVWFHAEKNLRTEVENDESHTVGHDRTKTIVHNETGTVGAVRDHSVKENDFLLVGDNRKVRVFNILEMQAGQKIILSCGKSRIEIGADGKINLTCDDFNFTAMNTGKINTKGGILDLNMDDRKEAVEVKGPAEKEQIKQDIENTFPPNAENPAK